jgi:hypothetical protein
MLDLMVSQKKNDEYLEAGRAGTRLALTGPPLVPLVWHQ